MTRSRACSFDDRIDVVPALDVEYAAGSKRAVIAEAADEILRLATDSH